MGGIPTFDGDDPTWTVHYGDYAFASPPQGPCSIETPLNFAVLASDNKNNIEVVEQRGEVRKLIAELFDHNGLAGAEEHPAESQILLALNAGGAKSNTLNIKGLLTHSHSHTDPGVEVHTLWTAPKYRGEGVARYLVDTLMHIYAGQPISGAVTDRTGAMEKLLRSRGAQQTEGGIWVIKNSIDRP